MRAVTMCIPEKYSKECAKMMEDSRDKGFPIVCISGRDRYDCIERVGRKEADIVAVDPEDMYLAAKNKLAEKAGYNVVEQVTLSSNRIIITNRKLGFNNLDLAKFQIG